MNAKTRDTRAPSAWTQPRERSAPITLGINVDSTFEALGLLNQVAQQRSEIRCKCNDPALPTRELEELTVLDMQISEVLSADHRHFLVAYKRTAEGIFQEHGIQAPLNVVDLSGVARDAFQFDNELVGRLAQLARTHTPLPMTGKPVGAQRSSPAAALLASGLDYLSRARAALAQERYQRPADAIGA